MIAAVIPAAVRSKTPINKPIIPWDSAASKAPWIRECPKLVMGSKAPPPTLAIKKSYIPKESRAAPTQTKIAVIWPGVNLVLSRISSAIKHIRPQKRNELIKYIISPPNILNWQ